VTAAPGPYWLYFPLVGGGGATSEHLMHHL
jgi:hypothetical protein